MSSKQEEVFDGFDIGTARICALVGSFSDGGLDIVYRDLQGHRFELDNIDLDFTDRTIVKKQKPKGGSYVR
ncbi:MAG: hypothetical protein HZC44_00745 [Geobacter sp.]|nr:hypothetical protein [Geobacter sp.]